MLGFDRFTPEALADPYPRYDAFRRQDPVVGADRLWERARYGDVHRFFTDPARSADRSAAAKFQGEKAQMCTISSEPPGTHRCERLPVTIG